jgi:hypothetical protein
VNLIHNSSYFIRNNIISWYFEAIYTFMFEEQYIKGGNLMQAFLPAEYCLRGVPSPSGHQAR